MGYQAVLPVQRAGRVCRSEEGCSTFLSSYNPTESCWQHGRWEDPDAPEMDPVDSEISRMWRQGFSVHEIAVNVDMEDSAVSKRMQKMRADGIELPYRRKVASRV